MDFNFTTYNSDILTSLEKSIFSSYKVKVRVAGSRVYSDITAQREDGGEPYVSSLFFDFSHELNLNSHKTRVQVTLLGLFSSIFIANYTTFTENGLDFLVETEYGGIFEDHYVRSFWYDFVWQCKLSTFALGYSPNEPSKPDFAVLPQGPFEEYNSTQYSEELSGYHAKEVALCQSFGKEALLSWHLLKQHYGEKAKSVKLLNCQGSLDEPLLFNSLISKLSDIEGKVLDGRSVLSNFLVDHQRLRGVKYERYYYLHIIALMAAIDTNCKLILFGNEYERNYVDVVIADNVPTNFYTYDYDQTQTVAGKLNHLFSMLNADVRIGSLVANLTELQIQYLLYKVAPELYTIQHSCWNATCEKQWCYDCSKCVWITYICDILELPVAKDNPYIKTGVSLDLLKKKYKGYITLGDNHPAKVNFMRYFTRKFEESVGPMTECRKLYPDCEGAGIVLSSALKGYLEENLAGHPLYWEK